MSNNLVVICPTYRNPKYLDLFLKSAVEGKVCDSTQIVVSVDGYYDESKDVLEKYKGKIEILDLGQNRGMQTAINLAVYQTSGNTNLLTVNDDNILNYEYDFNLNRLNTDKTVYTVEQVEPYGPGMFNFISKDFGQTVETFRYDDFQEFAKQSLNKDWLSKAGRIFPFLISKKNFMIVNGFDTFYNSPNLCDWDFFLKLELMGLDFIRTRRALFYHFGSISTKKNAESHVFRDKESKAIEAFRYKWGFSPYNGVNNTKIPPNSWIIK